MLQNELLLEENPNNERAIAADNYFKDKKTILNYYKLYLNNYSAKGNKELIYLAEIRSRDIKEELHLSGE